MSKSINKPSIRFNGFTDDWENQKISDVFETVTDYVAAGSFADIAANVKYLDSQSYAQLVRTMDLKNGFTSSSEVYVDEHAFNYLYRVNLDKECIILPNIGNCGEVYLVKPKDLPYPHNVLGPNAILVRTEKYSNEFMSVLLQADDFQHKLSLIISPNGQTKFNKSELKNIEMALPTSKKEQTHIGDTFLGIDNLIALHQRKYDQLQVLKNAMLEKMFPKNGSRVPELRFKGFADAWEPRKLEDMCTIITKQTGFDYSAAIKPSLVTTKEVNTYSFIQNKDFEGTNINLDTDFFIPISVAERYPKITLDQPSLLISISGRIGNVGLYSLSSKAFIGGAVGICKLKNIEDGKTALYELLAPIGQKYFNSLIKASSHANITVEDIRKIYILLPKDEAEKRKLNSYFENLDNFITLHQRKIDALKNLKQSMLKKMFV